MTISYSLLRLSTVSLYLLVISAGLLFSPQPAWSADGCLTCHSKAEVNRKTVDPTRGLVLDSKALAKSVHADVDCTDCHTQLAEADASKAHKPKIGLPDCSGCHEEASKAYAGSVHGRAETRGRKEMARCGDCHGAHDIVKVTDQRSRVFKLRLPFTCAKCHKKTDMSRRHNIKAPKAAAQYMESIHGKALLKYGLTAAPSCTDCHGSHDIQPEVHPNSKINHANIPKTCGKCHGVIQQVYDKSVHGKKLAAKGKVRSPVCIDCHSAHTIERPTNGAFKLASDNKCGRCHSDRLRRYRETYHGKAIALGMSKVAACYDCHGHHDIMPTSDERSHLSKKNLLSTCRKCHPGANENFTAYMSHADHSDKEQYPRLYWTYLAMTTLLLSVFAFFGIHTLLWFRRSLVTMLRDKEAYRKARLEARKQIKGKIFVRFRPIDRFCHFLVIISFLLLVFTGMPLKFYQAGWAQTMFDVMGGAAVAAALHRLGALLTALYFIIHIGSILTALWRHRAEMRNKQGKYSVLALLRVVFGPDSPVPNIQDLKDFMAHLNWFFGIGPRPQFDRWTYWEKFDYLAVFWGVAVIGLSGLVMWIPEAVTQVLPGWVINLALVIHSDEALLAAGFIFTFHFFNSHFRVEKFPMDPVIFSGRITEAEMRHERGRLYERLKKSGKLDQERLGDEWERWKTIFTPFGMLAFCTGVGLVLAIYWAMASRLFFR